MTNEKIIERIQKLLNTAKDKAATENEAMIAALKAQELMAKYDISITDVSSVDDSEEIVEASYKVGNGNKWKFALANIIANNFCCKVFFYDKDTVVFYGYKKNADVARDVFKFLFNIGNKFAMRIYMERRNHNLSTKGIKNAYLLGFVRGIKEVLEKQCTALMLVTPKEVEEAYNNRSSEMKTVRNRYRTNGDEKIYNKGINDGRAVAQSRYIEG